ncbi:MAG: hypothetical protein APR53_00015 [Methanoculleus sp. SDB]|nr:MAG: hypothetical protein APR53_00015 [Methanoculleus sp. SDB]
MGDPVTKRRVLIDIGHPAQVHFFRYLAENLQADGHTVLFTARDKEVTIALLKAFGLPYEIRGELYKGMLAKAFGMLVIDNRLYRIARRFRPDLLIGFHNPYITHVSRLLGKPAIIFTDTENVGIASLLTFPFADLICTPSCFKEAIDPEKHVMYDGYKELAYLHPRYFTPDPAVPASLGIEPGEPFILLRLISWKASHDTDLQGIQDPEAFVRVLEQFGRVLISSERELDPQLAAKRLILPPEQFHSILAHASLYIGEGGTIATEAALLGTPSIHIEADRSGEASGNRCGNFIELRDQYDLMYFYPDEVSAWEKAREILRNPLSRAEWSKKRDRLLAEKIDVTNWMTDLIEGYPESVHAARFLTQRL